MDIFHLLGYPFWKKKMQNLLKKTVDASILRELKDEAFPTTLMLEASF